MFSIFLRKVSMIGWNLPINAQAVVKDADATIGFRVIEFITLVLEYGGLGKDGEAVGKPLRDEELTMIVFCQLYGDMPAISGRSLADIHRYIKHPTLHTSY